MSKIWAFVKNNFLTKKFLTFGIVGVMNTVIHLSVYQLFFIVFSAGPFWSNTVAFICASTFSYFMNAIFTFKPKTKSGLQFSVIMTVYFARMMTSNGLNVLFDYIMIHWFSANYELYPSLSAIAPFFASALLIPISFFALDIVFKKTDITKN